MDSKVIAFVTTRKMCVVVGSGIAIRMNSLSARLHRGLASSSSLEERRNEMAKFRKKQIIVEAVQITDSTFTDPHPNTSHVKGILYNPVTREVSIRTLEGEMIGRIGDWIITGVKGEHYPCKPDIFEESYEPMEQK